MENIFESYSPIKIYLPGCQMSSQYILSTNDIYLVYCSSKSIVILEEKTKKIKNFLYLGENLIKTIALNKKNKKELAIVNNFEIIIYDIEKEENIKHIQCENIIYIEFNSNDKLIVLTSKGEIYYHDLLLSTKSEDEIPKYTQIKVKNKPICLRCYPFNSNDLAYANNKNEVYLHNIFEEKKENPYIKLPSFKGEDYIIITMEWYDVDENFKYILIGSNTSRIFLIDFINNANPIIINEFEQIGNSILSLMWLIYQPGSFISITSRSNKIYYFNVSKNIYKDIKSISNDLITQCIKFDNESILFSTEYNDIFIYNLKNNNFTFNICSPHTKSVLDLKFNPFNKDIFATCSLDGRVKLWNIKNNNPIKTIIIKNISNKNDENDNINVLYIKWSPLNKDLITTGDSLLYLRIYEINKNKQICNFLCENKNYKGENNNIQSIDWDKKNNIIIASQNSIHVCNFEENEKKINLINLINTEIDVYKVIFNPNKENSLFISCSDGQIKFYDFILEKKKFEKANNIFQGHKYTINDMKFNKDNNLLATASNDFRIGIWEYSNEKIENVKYLMGHTDNVTSIQWLNNNILISASFDNSIKFWNCKNLICINTIKEHQSGIFCIDNCPLYPSLIFSCSNDDTIRAFNFTNLIKLNELIKLEEKNKSQIDLFGKFEILSKDYLYEESIDEFFIDIKEKDNSLFHLYLNKKNDLKEINKILNDKNSTYLIKNNEKMNKLIKNCLILGEYEKCCELLMLLNNWEDAICIAPNVSLDYWKYVTNKYTIYLSNNSNENKIISGLLSNNSKITIDELILRKEYEDAKLVWLTRKNKKLIKDKPKIVNEDLEKNKEFLNKLHKELKENKDFLNLICNSSNYYLDMGFPIKACNSFLLIENNFKVLKILIQSCQFELAFLLMKYTNCLIYNNEIITYIYKKRKDITSNGILKEFINESKCDYHKYCLLKNLKENDINIENNDKNFEMVKNNDINGLFKIFYEESAKLINGIFENKIELNEVKNIIELIDVIKYMEAPYNIIEKNTFERLIITVIILEILNNNNKAIICIIKEFIILKKMLIEDNLDKKALNLIYNYIKDLDIKDNYYLDENEKKIVESLIQKEEININYIELRDKIESFNNELISKFKCENNQFYYIKSEIFPKNIENKRISTYSNKIIKSKFITLESNSTISLSEFLEMNKYLYIA